MGPMGRGGARRRTRRRWMMISASQKQKLEKETGKSVENMSDEELEAEMKKRDMEVPKDESSEG